VILVTGSIRARADSIDRVLELSLDHVTRSRTEPGCLLHSCHRDVEDPLRVVFLEHWSDADALRAHFAASASADFVTAATDLAAEAPTINIYDATPTRV